ncbi:cysteine-rich venom protein-like [Discoglossus pictus]
MKVFLTLLFLASVMYPLVETYTIVPFESVDTNLPEAQEAIVSCHNNYRRNTNPPAANMLQMTYDVELAKMAKRWADKCFLNHSTADQRMLNGVATGENILFSRKCITWSDVCSVWHDECAFFEYGVGGTSKNEEYRHCTQIVWDSTHKIGCAVSQCPYKGNTVCFNVCNYSPAGNERKLLHVPYEKGEPCSKCPKYCDNKLCTNACKYQDTANNCKMGMATDFCEKDIYQQCNATCICRDSRIY